MKKSSSFSRRTYAAVSAPKKQLLCWEEHGVSSSDDKAEAINLLSRNSESLQDIVYLQDLSVGRKRSAEGGLLAVYADGYIRCFSSDLKEEKWEFTPPSLDGGRKDRRVVYAASTTLMIARKALLKNRMDVILPKSTPEDDTPEDTVLFTVSCRKHTFEARVFTIPAIDGDNRTPRELLILNLPGSPADGGDASGSSVFSVHFPTATLNYLSAERLTTYSLTSTIPSISSSLRLTPGSLEDPNLSSLLRVSPSTVLVATSEHVSLYDTKFTSLQARVLIQSSSTASSTPAVSRSSTPASIASSKVQGGVFLTAYLSELDLAIGYSQNGIVAIQLSRGSKEEGRKNGLLIDSLCRGVDGLEIPTVGSGRTGETAEGTAIKRILSKISTEKARLTTTMAKLQEARREENLEKFESAFAEYVGVKRTATQAPAVEEDTAMTNGDTSMALETSPGTSNKQLPEFVANLAHKSLSYEFVTAVLAHIFTPSTSADGDATLTISFYPPNIITYLAESGNLSSTLLPRNTTSTLVTSLATYDPSLRTLKWALSTITSISAPEVVSAVAAALAPTPNDNGNDNDLALKVIRSEVLRLALVRLDSFPASAVIASLKSGLSGEALTTLISLLRRELSVHDTENLHTYEEVGVGIGDMGIVSSLLTTALDSIGIGGLVLVDGADEFIAGLHEEVGDAVDAIEEAAGLKGILEEMFRHANWRRVAIERREGANNERTLEENTERRRKRLEIREKKAEGETGKNEGHIARLQVRRKPHQKRNDQKRQGNSVGALLPLGLAPPPPSSLPGQGLTLRGLVGSGMGTEVEKREMERKRGREANYRESLVAGVYSVESIVV